MNTPQTRQLETMLLLRFGPVWDGNLPSKAARDDLVNADFIDRGSGFQWLNENGIKTLKSLGLLHEETWREKPASKS